MRKGHQTGVQGSSQYPTKFLSWICQEVHQTPHHSPQIYAPRHHRNQQHGRHLSYYPPRSLQRKGSKVRIVHQQLQGQVSWGDKIILQQWCGCSRHRNRHQERNCGPRPTPPPKQSLVYPPSWSYGWQKIPQGRNHPRHSSVHLNWIHKARIPGHQHWPPQAPTYTTVEWRHPHIQSGHKKIDTHKDGVHNRVRIPLSPPQIPPREVWPNPPRHQLH